MNLYWVPFLKDSEIIWFTASKHVIHKNRLQCSYLQVTRTVNSICYMKKLLNMMAFYVNSFETQNSEWTLEDSNFFFLLQNRSDTGNTMMLNMSNNDKLLSYYTESESNSIFFSLFSRVLGGHGETVPGTSLWSALQNAKSGLLFLLTVPGISIFRRDWIWKLKSITPSWLGIWTKTRLSFDHSTNITNT